MGHPATTWPIRFRIGLVKADGGGGCMQICPLPPPPPLAFGGGWSPAPNQQPMVAWGGITHQNKKSANMADSTCHPKPLGQRVIHIE